mgnify:CR=1 FL=1
MKFKQINYLLISSIIYSTTTTGKTTRIIGHILNLLKKLIDKEQ